MTDSRSIHLTANNSILFLFFFFYNFIYLFIYFWLCWVFVSVRGLSPVVASGGHSSSRCVGLSLSRPLVVEHGSRRAGSVVVAHGLSCSAACGIFPDQGSNPCPLHRQADSQQLRHQGSPILFLFMAEKYSIVYMCHIFFIHSSVDGHLGCFHVLAIIKSAVMNMVVHDSF